MATLHVRGIPEGQSDLLETIRRRRYAAPEEIDSLVLLREDRGR
jgi:hypothetical protein